MKKKTLAIIGRDVRGSITSALSHFLKEEDLKSANEYKKGTHPAMARILPLKYAVP